MYPTLYKLRIIPIKFYLFKVKVLEILAKINSSRISFKNILCINLEKNQKYLLNRNANQSFTKKSLEKIQKIFHKAVLLKKLDT